MTTRDEYVAATKQRLDEWNAEMDTLEAKAEQAKEDDKTRYQEMLATLRAKRQEVEEQLAVVKAATEDSWTRFKVDSDRVWEAFKDSVQQFKSHFN
jgi:small-conductance mechanosensitive channel